MVLVDTSVWIECIRREGRMDYKIGLQGLIEVAEAVVCGPIKLEVLAGARSQDRSLLAACFDYIPNKLIDEGAWEFALHCAWRLRDEGHAVPWNDILIASLSLQWGCRVYAADPHFELMHDVLGVRLYQPGDGGKFHPERPR
jgi:predicted nucleic acid-binding protein